MTPEQRAERLKNVDERIMRASPPSVPEAGEYLPEASDRYLISAINRLTEAGLAIAAGIRVLATPDSPTIKQTGTFIVPERESDED